MANATVGALRVTLGLDSAAFTDGLSAAQKHLRDASKRLQSIGTNMAAVGTGLTAAVTGPLIGLGAIAVGEASEMRDALGQVNAALISMGNVGGRSLEQLKSQADSLASSSLFEDDQILRGVTSNLLTFGNIAGVSFDRAQQAAVDLSARLGQDLQASAIMVGKALNDPVKGLSALRRVGIQFTADQEAMIKGMVAVGDTAGAQAIMLGELERQFGGSAKAARDAANPMERMRLSFAAMAGDIGTILLPFIDRIAAAFSGLTERFGKLSPGMQQFAVVAGLVAAALGPLLIAAGALVASMGVLLPIIGTIGAPFLAFAAAAAAVSVALYVFRDDLIPIMQSFGAAVADNIGPKIGPLFEALKGLVGTVGAAFAAIFGDGTPGSATETLKMFGTVITRVFGAAIEVVTGAINVITNILKALGALLRGDFSAMWGFLGAAVMSAVRGIAGAFQTLFPEVVSWVRQTYEGVKTWLLDRFSALVSGIVEKVQSVGRAFYNLYDAVVGHSYIPDMVIAIAEWMGPRLQDAMVNPALDAVGETSSAFDGMATGIQGTMDSLFQSIAAKDWRGALGGVLDMFGKMGGKVGTFARVGSAVLGALSGGGARTESVGVRQSSQSWSGGRLGLEIVPSPYFDTRVREVSGPVTQQAANQMGRTVLDATRRSAPGMQQQQRRLGTT